MLQNAGQTITQTMRETNKAGSEEPLYRRIQATMRARIAGGEWVTGQVLPGRPQLCEEFGTTRVTLDKAIQGLVAEGVLRTAKRIGTFVAEQSVAGASSAPVVHQMPRALRIGVVVERNSNPPSETAAFDDNFYFGPIFQGIRDAVSSKAIDTVFAHLHHSEYLEFFRESRLDGGIFVTPSLEELPSLHQLLADRVSFVATGISSSDPSDAAVPCEDTDNRQGAIDAVEHLLSLGHRRIAIVNLATATANNQDRMEGYCQALKASKLSIDAGDLVLMANYNPSRFESRVEEWLLQAIAADRLPTAVFTCDYMMTLATLRVLRRHGLRVPEDISVVGFDDPVSAAHLTPPLTTVRQPVYNLGRRAAERLLACLQEGTAPHGPEILPTELIVRESTCPPRASNIIRREVILS